MDETPQKVDLYHKTYYGCNKFRSAVS